MSISLIRPHIEKIKTPRALHCEFPLGRPLGKPEDPAYQRRVLDAVFELLKRPEGPVFKVFDEEIPDSANEPLDVEAPPVPEGPEHEAVREAKALRSAYDKAVRQHGRTNVGRVADADGIPGAIEAFVRVVEGTPAREAQFPRNNYLESSKDIMSYYEEAAAALAGETPKARAAESWFFQKTAAGRLLKEAKAKMQEDKVPAAFYVTPATQ